MQIWHCTISSGAESSHTKQNDSLGNEISSDQLINSKINAYVQGHKIVSDRHRNLPQLVEARGNSSLISVQVKYLNKEDSGCNFLFEVAKIFESLTSLANIRTISIWIR